MNKVLTIKQGEAIPYSIRASKRARTIRITIHQNGAVCVSTPRGVSEHTIQKFVETKRLWILEHTQNLKRDTRIKLPHGRDAFARYSSQALNHIANRVSHINQHYRVPLGKIVVKNHKRQWGSCSSTKNLYFNYRILFLPRYLSDYVITHELCHIQEMNHSSRFWKLVGRHVENYRACEKELGRYIFF